MKNLQGDWIVSEPSSSIPPMRGMQWGLIAGLAGTIAMDITLMGGLPALGLPIGICYLIIGKTAAKFFTILGIMLPGDVMMGVVVYHLLGPLLGAVYGLLVSQIKPLQRTSLKKSLLYALLYAEVVSQLILTTIPILLRIPAQEALLWFAGSSVLHAIWGAVMGIAMYDLVRLYTTNNSNLRIEGTGGIS